LITPDRLSHLGWQGWLLAILAIVVVRPASMLLSLIKTGMPRAEKLTAAWFGPKGFASVVYGLLVLQADIPNGDKLFDLIAVTIALSIILHSSTDVPVAHKLRIEPPDHLPAGYDTVRASELDELAPPTTGSHDRSP
jgi:NhaP-type Na+/H+ or K+/H+ antiporter